MIIDPFGTGLINHTWKVTSGSRQYILQRVNHDVFLNPRDIAANIRRISDHLGAHFPDYLFITPLSTRDAADLLFVEGDGYYRLFPFLAGSHAKDVVQTAKQAFEAATQFGRFTRLLTGIDLDLIKTTITSFHDLSLRYEQFLSAIKNGHGKRIKASGTLIGKLLGCNQIVVKYRRLLSNPEFKLRVTHHDTKISNVLFDKNDKAVCVIDLDTVMPCFFISDVGDMMRTYLSPVSEEETDLEKIVVRDEFYEAIVSGYYNEMKDELTVTEKNHLFYAGCFMIYMQALRFLTDHLNNDSYYGARYEGHNFNRAENQYVLLNQLMEKEKLLSRIGVG